MSKRYLLIKVKFRIANPEEIAVPAEEVQWVSGFQPSLSERVKPRLPDSEDLGVLVSEQTRVDVTQSEIQSRTIHLGDQDVVTGDFGILLGQDSIYLSNINRIEEIVHDSMPGIVEIVDDTRVQVRITGSAGGPRPFAQAPIIMETAINPPRSPRVDNELFQLETAIRDSTDMRVDVITSEGLIKFNTNDDDIGMKQIMEISSHMNTFMANREVDTGDLIISINGEVFR